MVTWALVSEPGFLGVPGKSIKKCKNM